MRPLVLRCVPLSLIFCGAGTAEVAGSLGSLQRGKIIHLIPSNNTPNLSQPPCLIHTLQDIKFQESALIPAWICIFSLFPALSCSPFPPTPLPKTITQQKPPHPAPNSCTAPRLPLFPVESCQGTGSEGQQSSSVVVGRFHGTVNLRHFALMLLKAVFPGQWRDVTWL